MEASRGGRRRRKGGRNSAIFMKAKKFGAQGKLGRGFEIDTETYNYFLRILELCQKNEFESMEEKTSFIENSLKETEGKEVNYSSNQATSRVLELILSFVKDEEVLLKFASSFTPSLRTVSTDPYASFVLEKLLDIISMNWEDNKSLSKWFRKTCKFVLNNYEDFVFDHFANRVMRRVLQVLSKTTHLFLKTQFVSVKANPLLKQELPNESKELVKKNVKILSSFASDFLNWPQFNDLFQNETTSGFVQVLIRTLKESGKDELVAKGVENISTALKVHEEDLMTNKVYLHSLEAAISASNEENYVNLYNNFLKGKASKFLENSTAKFTIGKFIKFASTREILEEICEEITATNGFESLYESNHHSIFVDYADALKRLKGKQNVLVELISKLEKSDLSKQNFVYTIATWNAAARKRTLKEDEKGEKDTPRFSTDMSGTFLIQRFLEFHKPVKIVQSFLALNRGELQKLGLDPKGCHIFHTFFKSPTVGEKNKEKLIINIKDLISEFSTNKFGSRIIDTIWEMHVLKYRDIITGQLVEKKSLIESNQYGMYIVQRACIQLYKRDKKLWATTVMMTNNTEKEDFLKSLISDSKRKAQGEDSDSKVEECEENEINAPKKKKKKKDKVD